MKFFKNLLLWFKTFPKRLYGTLLRFPASVLCSVLIFILFELQENFNILEDATFAKAIFTLTAGIILFAAGELLLEAFGISKPKHRIITFAAVYGLLQSYYFFAGKFDGRSFAQFAMLILCVSLLAIVALHIKKGNGFEKTSAVILVRLALSAFFASVLFLGLAAVIAGIDFLIIDLKHDWVFVALRVSYILFLPMMFFMGIPRKDSETDYPKGLKALLNYVILPIIIAFSAVLYLYYIKLIITRSLPVSEAGGISLWFLGVCIPTLILISPFEGKLSVSVTKILPYLLLPVIFVLYLAAFRQIYIYGVTVTRYLVVVGGFGALISVILIKIKAGRLQRFACIAVALCSLMSAFGPQGAYNVASKSQVNRLEHLLIQNNMLIDGKIVPSEDVSEYHKSEITGLIRYIERSDLNMPDYLKESDLKDNLGFSLRYATSFFTNDRQNNWVEVSDYDYISYEYGNEDVTFTIDGKDVEISKKHDNGITIIINGEVVCDVSMDEISKEIYGKIDKNSEEQSPESLIYEFENIHVKIKYMFRYISFDKALYNHGNYAILLKIK